MEKDLVDLMFEQLEVIVEKENNNSFLLREIREKLDMELEEQINKMYRLITSSQLSTIRS